MNCTLYYRPQYLFDQMVNYANKKLILFQHGQQRKQNINYSGSLGVTSHNLSFST